MTVKMTDVETQRFVGNVTTHTPGVLKGGQQAIDRHPKRAEILVGGADGAAKLFKMDVQAAPAGGGNPNQIREYEALPGRVFDVRFSPDGTRAFAGSSLDGKGQVRSYETDSGKVQWTLDVPESAIYALACSPDGATLAAAGSDGQIRLIDAASGQLRKAFLPVDITASAEAAAGWVPGADLAPQPATPAAAAPALAVAKLESEPTSIRIAKPTDYVQVLLTATLSDGARMDATRLAAWKVEGDVGQVSTDGRFTPAKGGAGKVVAEFSGQRMEIPVEVTGLEGSYVPDFIRDVNPILSRLGCNQGTCHGAAKGKNGFKLSLRGYDALSDIRALTDDLASRRVSTASPDDSLILLKATGAAPHQGGRLIAPGSPYYNILRRWIANGATLDLSTPRVAKIEVQPKDPIVPARRRIAADARDRHLRRRRRPRRDSRSVHRKRQHRSRHRRPDGRADRHSPRRSLRAGPLRRRLRRHDADRDGRPQRLRLAAAGNLGQDRRTGRRQVAADEDPAFGPVRRRRVHPPRVPGSDGPAAHGRGRAGVPGRPARRCGPNATS